MQSKKPVHEEKINEFVLSCDCTQIHARCLSHTPNKQTANALNASQRGEGHKARTSINELFNYTGI